MDKHGLSCRLVHSLHSFVVLLVMHSHFLILLLKYVRLIPFQWIVMTNWFGVSQLMEFFLLRMFTKLCILQARSLIRVKRYGVMYFIPPNVFLFGVFFIVRCLHMVTCGIGGVWWGHAIDSSPKLLKLMIDDANTRRRD